MVFDLFLDNLLRFFLVSQNDKKLFQLLWVIFGFSYTFQMLLLLIFDQSERVHFGFKDFILFFYIDVFSFESVYFFDGEDANVGVNASWLEFLGFGFVRV